MGNSVIEKVTAKEFDALSDEMELQLMAVFGSMKEDVLKFLDNIEAENEHDIISGINEIINGEVKYADSKKR